MTLNLFAWNPVIHNPPLLFDVEADPGEQYPLDIKEYKDILEDFEACTYLSSECSYCLLCYMQVAVKMHNSTMVFAEDQEGRGGNPALAICCNKQTYCVCGQDVKVYKKI